MRLVSPLHASMIGGAIEVASIATYFWARKVMSVRNITEYTSLNGFEIGLIAPVTIVGGVFGALLGHWVFHRTVEGNKVHDVVTYMLKKV